MNMIRMMIRTFRNPFMGVVLAGLAVTAAYAAAPDPINWRPTDVTGPALFIGVVTQTEEFRNPPNVDYACHTVMDAHPKVSSLCVSNACGLERMTIRTDTVYAGSVAAKITISSILGEWCEGASVSGRKFLIAVLPDGNWSAFEVISKDDRQLALPDITGCLGKVDIPHLLQVSGVVMDSAIGPSMGWRTKWTPAIGADCPKWMPESLDKKALAIDTIVAAWKAVY